VLRFLERHAIGILTTIMFHLLVITVFLIIRFQEQKQQTENRIELNLLDPQEIIKEMEEMKKEAKTLSEKEFVKAMEQEYLGSNVPKNEAEPDAKKSIDDMVKNIQDELGIKDYAQAEREKDKEVSKIEKVEKKEVKEVQQKPQWTRDGSGAMFYDGGATKVKYYLVDRMHIYMPIPIYQCQGSGKVVLDILVNRNGYVVAANVNEKESQIPEECIREVALRNASITRFNEKPSAPEKQSGRITYTFVAQ
jgi:hypothetical protein